MNRILIIAHAPLAHALRQCALHVFPDCGPSVVALDVAPNVPPEETLAMARTALQQLGGQRGADGVLVLTDVFGATPCNVAQKMVGVNVPMLLRTVCYRHEPLEALVSRAVTGGTQGVMQVAVTAPQNQAKKNHAKDQHDHQQ
jgi:PTS system mannose-specific IIA component